MAWSHPPMMSVFGRLETMKTAMAHPEAQLEVLVGGGQQCDQKRRAERTRIFVRQSAPMMGRFSWYRFVWPTNWEVEGGGREEEELGWG